MIDALGWFALPLSVVLLGVNAVLFAWILRVGPPVNPVGFRRRGDR